MSAAQRQTFSNADQASRFYADNYEHLYHTYLSDPSLTQSIVGFLQPLVNPDRTALVDLGCGLGMQLANLSLGLSIPLKNTVGVDESPGMRDRFRSTFDASGEQAPTFIEGDFTASSKQAEIIEHLKTLKITHVVFICLGNTIGLIDPEKYQTIADLVGAAGDAIQADAKTHLIVEYREGKQYRALCATSRPKQGDTDDTNAYGSVELLGRQGADFIAFYIRDHINRKRYKVTLYSLSTKANSENGLTCSFSAMTISDGFYVEEQKLLRVCKTRGLVRMKLNAASKLEAGKILAFSQTR